MNEIIILIVYIIAAFLLTISGQNSGEHGSY